MQQYLIARWEVWQLLRRGRFRGQSQCRVYHHNHSSLQKELKVVYTTHHSRCTRATAPGTPSTMEVPRTITSRATAITRISTKRNTPANTTMNDLMCINHNGGQAQPDIRFHLHPHIPIHHTIHHHLSVALPTPIQTRTPIHRSLRLSPSAFRPIIPLTKNLSHQALSVPFRAPGRAKASRNFWRLSWRRSVAVTRNALRRWFRLCGLARLPKRLSPDSVRFWGSAVVDDATGGGLLYIDPSSGDTAGRAPESSCILKPCRLPNHMGSYSSLGAHRPSQINPSALSLSLSLRPGFVHRNEV